MGNMEITPTNWVKGLPFHQTKVISISFWLFLFPLFVPTKIFRKVCSCLANGYLNVCIGDGRQSVFFFQWAQVNEIAFTSILSNKSFTFNIQYISVYFFSFSSAWWHVCIKRFLLQQQPFAWFMNHAWFNNYSWVVIKLFT